MGEFLVVNLSKVNSDFCLVMEAYYFENELFSFITSFCDKFPVHRLACRLFSSFDLLLHNRNHLVTSDYENSKMFIWI